MNIIKLQVKNFEIIPLEKQYVVENQVNEFAIEFEFDDSWDYETKYVIFDNEETTYKRPIINNQVIIPSELLNGRTTIQIYGQNVENGEIVKRKPSYKYSFSILNSLSTEGQEESDLPKPTQWEIYISQIETMLDEFTTDYNEFKDDITEQFNDLKEDCESKCDDVIERLGKDEQDIQTNTDNIRANAEAIDALNTSLLDYSLITETGNKISMSINPQTYVITLSLKDKNDNVLSTQSVDLPLETMIVSASYSNGILTFTLKNGQTLQVPIGDLISGLVSTDTFNQTVQGLSNRITAIENDYLKSTDKTELQEQITANADDIGNIKEEQLTQNADIESLQQENERLQRIVSGLPTKNASGTNFVLNDMVNCEIKEISLNGDTLQDGTPTPESPIAIQTVTGNQTIQFTGKNLCGIKNVATATYRGVDITLQDGYILLNGTVNESNSEITINNSLESVLLNINDYILTLFVESGSIANGNVRFYVKNTLNESLISVSNVSQRETATTTKSQTLSKIGIYLNNGVTFNNYKVKLLLCSGTDIQTSYEQYSGTTFPISLGNIELCKIGTYQDRIYRSNDKWYLEKNVRKYTRALETVIISGNRFRVKVKSRSDLHDVDISVNVFCPALINICENIDKGSQTQLRYNGGWGGIAIVFSETVRTAIGLDKTEQQLADWFNNNCEIYAGINPNYDYPEITEITDTTLISQLEALNNYILLTNNTIISNGNLPVINDITGYVDIMSLLSTQNNRNVVEEKKSKPIEKPIEEPIENGEER